MWNLWGGGHGLVPWYGASESKSTVWRQNWQIGFNCSSLLCVQVIPFCQPVSNSCSSNNLVSFAQIFKHTPQVVLWFLKNAFCVIFYIYEHVFAIFLSTPSMTWAGQCRWPGLEMAQGWVLDYSPFAPNRPHLQCYSSVTWVGQTWLAYSVNIQPACKEPCRLHNEFPHIRVSCTLLNVPCSTFLKLNLLSWQVILALTTFQVPFFMLRLGQSKLYRR